MRASVHFEIPACLFVQPYDEDEVPHIALLVALSSMIDPRMRI